MIKRILALLLALLLTACAHEKPETPAFPEAPSPSPEERIGAFRSAAAEIEEYQQQWTAEALTQAELNAAAEETFRRWEELRQQILQVLIQEEGPSLEAEEQRWAEDRESAQKAEAALWDGGSGAPLAYYSTGSSCTKKHCDDLILRLEAAFGLSELPKQ